MKIKTVTVIGANGTMGCNISGIFASFGNAKVYMISRNIEKSKKAVDRVVNSVKADSIRNNLIPADFSMLPQCVADSDLVFESVAENLEAKTIVTKEIAKYLKPGAVACSGTSGLSITTLAEQFSDESRKKYFGIHMFNPPYSMILCELVLTKYTDKDSLKDIKKYLSETLLRTVVEVNDSPAFLGNRIGFQFINEAMQYAEKYKYNGGIDYIDSILGPFSGRSMAPLATSDFVGLDVHKAIVDNIYNNTKDYAHDTFVFPEFAVGLVNQGKLGRKAGEGLYKRTVLDNGNKKIMVYDITTGEYRERVKYSFPFVEKMIADFRIGDYKSAFFELVQNHSVEAEICLLFLIKYVIYSLYAGSLVGFDIHSADDVMATGFNWCPPQAVIEALSTVSNFKELVFEKFDDSVISKEEIQKLLNDVESSKYDYRLYFKSAK